MVDSSSWNLQAGDQVSEGRYALSRLGGGNRYEAYLAWDDRLFTVVVVKLLRPDRVEDRSALAGLVHELEMLERLDHPLIVRAFGGIIEAPRPHIVLEHLEGPRLSTLLRKYGTLPLEQLVPLVMQMCSALHYLETEEIVHLDVKPSNIVMGSVPRLIDLSVTHTVAAASTINYPVGTDAYMSPEQCDSTLPSDISTASDVWGLGATLYEAVEGKTPFVRTSRSSEEERWPQLTQAPLPPSGTVPDALGNAIMSCLELDPRARPSPAELSGCFEPTFASLPLKPVLGRLKPKMR